MASASPSLDEALLSNCSPTAAIMAHMKGYGVHLELVDSNGNPQSLIRRQPGRSTGRRQPQ